MRIAYVDPFSGASGEMMLGALIDCGVPVDELRSVLVGLRLSGWTLTAERVAHDDVDGTRVRVTTDGARHPLDESATHALLNDAILPEPVKEAARTCLEALFRAGARVDGIDVIIQIVGVAAGVQLLGVERIFSGSPALGRGFMTSAGRMVPIPAPATARLLAAVGAPSHVLDIEAELLPPTGAAILTTLAEFERPEFQTTTVGYGFGDLDLSWPHALRLWIGELESSPLAESRPGTASASALLLETTVDNMNPEHYELLIERMYDAGAVDVYLAPIIIRQGRPATRLSAIVPASDRQAVEQVLVDNSPTFDILRVPIERTQVRREWERIATRWGEVRVKLRVWRDRVIDAVPEYADCLEVARASDAPLRLIYGEAERIGAVFVGRRRTSREWEGIEIDE